MTDLRETVQLLLSEGENKCQVADVDGRTLVVEGGKFQHLPPLPRAEPCGVSTLTSVRTYLTECRAENLDAVLGIVDTIASVRVVGSLREEFRRSPR